MKKNVFKSAFAIACVVAASVSGIKAYNAANQSKTDMLLAENVEALTVGDGFFDIYKEWYNSKDYIAREVTKTVTIHYTQWYSVSETYKCNKCIPVTPGTGKYAHCSKIPNPC